MCVASKESQWAIIFIWILSAIWLVLCLIKGFRIDWIDVTRPAPHPTTQSKEISKEKEEKEASDRRAQE